MRIWVGLVATVGVLTAAACGSSIESSAATGTGGGAGSGTGGSGGGGPCGGKRGETCAKDEYCDFAGDICGADDGGGVCTPRPQDCAGLHHLPTCGCDGQIYDNACEANAAGVDASTVSCATPPGTFKCGTQFCKSGKEFCMSDPEPPPNHYSSCTPLPADCGSSPSCACLTDIACGNCTPTSDGGLLVSCGAG